MRKTPPRFQKLETELPLSELARQGEDWLMEGQIRQLSPRTQEARRFLIDKLLWFLRQRQSECCGTSELRAFLAYITTAHQSDTGRWGNGQMRRAVRPRTVQTYFINLKTFFAFVVKEGVLEESPLATVTPPVARQDQVQPFTTDQVKGILSAARRSRNRRRDEALVLFLLDTGCRATEVCTLRWKDVDLDGRRCTVLGKGNKTRSIYFGKDTSKALWAYLKEEPREPDEPLFLADRGTGAGEPLTRSGLFQLIERLGKAAQLEAVRCSPHTFRHTFAVEFLRGGGNVFALQQMLGHTSLKMTNRYVALAQADLEAQHRQFSPADRLRRA